MESKLFSRKKQEKITSQEELSDYMRVTSPRLWMILGAVALLLVGFIVYAATATLENTMSIRLDVQSFDTLPEYREESGVARMSLVSCELPPSMADTVKTGMRVRLGKHEGTVSFVVENPDAVNVVVDMDGGYVPLPDGVYDAELILESATPISFLWN